MPPWRKPNVTTTAVAIPEPVLESTPWRAQKKGAPPKDPDRDGEEHITTYREGDTYVLKIPVPNWAAGKVVGEKGWFVNQWSAETGAELKHRREDGKIRIAGKRAQVMKAKSLVLEEMKRLNAWPPLESEPIDEVQEEVLTEILPLPGVIYGKVIGKDGANIAGIRARTGLSFGLQDQPPHPDIVRFSPEDIRQVTVTGTRRQIQSVVDEILHIATKLCEVDDETEVHVVKPASEVFTPEKLASLERHCRGVRFDLRTGGGEYDVIHMSGDSVAVSKAWRVVTEEARAAAEEDLRKKKLSEDGAQESSAPKAEGGEIVLRERTRSRSPGRRRSRSQRRSRSRRSRSRRPRSRSPGRQQQEEVSSGVREDREEQKAGGGGGGGEPQGEEKGLQQPASEPAVSDVAPNVGQPQPVAEALVPAADLGTSSIFAPPPTQDQQAQAPGPQGEAAAPDVGSAADDVAAPVKNPSQQDIWAAIAKTQAENAALQTGAAPVSNLAAAPPGSDAAAAPPERKPKAVSMAPVGPPQPPPQLDGAPPVIQSFPKPPPPPGSAGQVEGVVVLPPNFQQGMLPLPVGMLAPGPLPALPDLGSTLPGGGGLPDLGSGGAPPQQDSEGASQEQQPWEGEWWSGNSGGNGGKGWDNGGKDNGKGGKNRKYGGGDWSSEWSSGQSWKKGGGGSWNSGNNWDDSWGKSNSSWSSSGGDKWGGGGSGGGGGGW